MKSSPDPLTEGGTAMKKLVVVMFLAVLFLSHSVIASEQTWGQIKSLYSMEVIAHVKSGSDEIQPGPDDQWVYGDDWLGGFNFFGLDFNPKVKSFRYCNGCYDAVRHCTWVRLSRWVCSGDEDHTCYQTWYWVCLR